MNLEEKFREVIPKNDYNHENKTVDKCVQICDEFTKSFTEWKDDNTFRVLNGKYQGKYYFYNDLEYYTTTELLEIYKQGL